MTIKLHFTSRKNIDKKTQTNMINYTIARYQYTGKYIGIELLNKFGFTDELMKEYI